VGRVAGSERLHDVEGPPVANGPWNKGQDGEQPCDRRASRHPGESPAFVAVPDDGGAEGDREQSAVGAQECGVAPGERLQDGSSPCWRFEETQQAIKGECDGEEFKRLRERRGGGVRGEGTEAGQPERPETGGGGAQRAFYSGG